MNIYRVTFHTESTTFKTLLRAESLENLKFEMHEMINRRDLFEVEGLSNRYFVVKSYNFIEIETLLNNEGLKFEELFKLEDEELVNVFQNVSDSTIVAIALKSIKENERERLLSIFPDGRRELVKEEIENLWSINVSEILDAQEQILKVATKLKK